MTTTIRKLNLQELPLAEAPAAEHKEQRRRTSYGSVTVAASAGI